MYEWTRQLMTIRARSVRRAGTVAVLALGAAGLAAQTAPGSHEAPLVYSAVLDGIIHPVSAEFLTEAMNEADDAGAELLVVTLRTPGGLVDSTRDIVTRMVNAKTPVAVFIGPSGARAASAGFILTIAADVAAMAPGTHIGAAHPVSGGGEPMDETMAQKAAADVAAYARTLANSRGRNVTLAEEAVNESRAFTEQEALDASPPLIDLVAANLQDLLAKLDGRTIKRFDGTSVELETSNPRIVEVEMGLRQRVLSAIAHPNIAYLLLSLGMLGLTIELWSPGAILPGVVGGVSLLLAFFALQLLPVNYVGVLLILLGLLLLGLELVVASFGLLTVGGIISLVFGSMILVDSTAPELQLSLQWVLPIVLGAAGVTAFLVKLGVSALRQPAATGTAGMIDQVGEALGPIGPGAEGRVAVHGEIWRATSEDSIPQGSRVRVVKIDGLTLTVRRL
jgi:membrane-bound serine protease (ClpP class)